MRMQTCLFVVAIILSGCKPKAATPPADASSPKPSITDREWVLASLGDNTAPLGNGGKPVTLTLQSSDSRAFGNAGCNRYSGPHTLSGDQLSFGPAISTKMACEQGTDVEIAFLSMLNNVTGYQATDTSLTLVGEGGPLARFR
jgi:heat shock protein HslJ